MSPSSRLAVMYRVIEAMRIAQSVRAAVELGVFHRLEAPTAPAVLAEAVGVAPDRLQPLLDALESLELVGQEAGRYRSRIPGAAAERILHLRDVRAGLYGEPAWQAHTPSGASAEYPEVVDALSAMVREPAAAVAAHLAEPGLRVLEIGAGACGWSLALAAASPGATVVANDLPGVIERSRQAVAAAGMSERYRFVTGDAFAIELGDRCFDRVLVPMVLHLFDEPRAEALVHRAAACVAPGGQLAVVDLFARDDRPSLGASLYTLELRCRTAAGRVHRADRVRRWMEAAGLVVRAPWGTGTVPEIGVVAGGRT
ncbi:MAG: cyclopropane fatty-acyl-phospholipid synthase-like methyltransferase [Myxococcota bacterium]